MKDFHPELAYPLGTLLSRNRERPGTGLVWGGRASPRPGHHSLTPRLLEGAPGSSDAKPQLDGVASFRHITLCQLHPQSLSVVK